MNTRILADLFSLDLHTSENEGGSLNTAHLYKYLLDVRTYGFNNNDPALALQRRKVAREGAEILTETTLNVVRGGSVPGKGLISKAAGAVEGAVTGVASHIPVVGGLFGGKKGGKTETGSLRWYGQNVVREIIAAGKTPEEAAEISWLTAVAGVGAPVGVVSNPNPCKPDLYRFLIGCRSNIITSSLPMFSTSSSRKRTLTTGRQFNSWRPAPTWILLIRL